LKIIDFTEDHVEQAIKIAKENYEVERKSVEILPEAIELPDFSPFVENGLGVAAFVDEKMIGYLCCYSPFEKAFGTTNAIGVWSPIHGNGIIDCEYKNVFAGMYQEAAIKWINKNILENGYTRTNNK
jgi:hypothetical protein